MKALLKISFSLGIIIGIYAVISFFFNIFIVSFSFNSLTVAPVDAFIWLAFFLILYINVSVKAKGRTQPGIKTWLILTVLIVSLYIIGTYFSERIITLLVSLDDVYLDNPWLVYSAAIILLLAFLVLLLITIISKGRNKPAVKALLVFIITGLFFIFSCLSFALDLDEHEERQILNSENSRVTVTVEGMSSADGIAFIGVYNNYWIFRKEVFRGSFDNTNVEVITKPNMTISWSEDGFTLYYKTYIEEKNASKHFSYASNSFTD